MKKQRKKIIFSGIQPSGTLHIGNYIGAIRSWIQLANESEKYKHLYFSIVDYHALTNIRESNKPFQKYIWDMIFDILALGLDLNKCSLFIQSSIHQHLELFWILSSFTSIGDLFRMNQYKEKSSLKEDFIPASLLNYPILQAADILLYKAEIVPVGEDQKQHIELCCRIAKRFNYKFNKKIFPYPKALLSNSSSKILGIDGTRKMSKAYNNYISFSENLSSINLKIMKSLTDSNRKKKTDPGNPSICNIFSIHKEFSLKSQISSISKDCQEAKIGCVDCKKILIENLWNFIHPIQEKRKNIVLKKEYYKEIILDTAKKMRLIANKTIEEIFQLLNLNKY